MRLPLPTVPLVLAGVAWTAGQAVLPDMGTGSADRLAAVAADRPAQALSAALFVIAGGLLVVAAAIAVPRAPAGRGAGLTRTGLLMIALGGVWLAAGRGAFNVLMYRLTDPAVAGGAAVDVLDADVGPGYLVLVLTLPALLLGPVVLAAGVLRAGAGPRGWLALVAWVVGVGAFVVSEFSVKAVEVAGLAVATVALALLGDCLARRPRPTAESAPVPLAARPV